MKNIHGLDSVSIRYKDGRILYSAALSATHISSTATPIFSVVTGSSQSSKRRHFICFMQLLVLYSFRQIHAAKWKQDMVHAKQPGLNQSHTSKPVFRRQ